MHDPLLLLTFFFRWLEVWSRRKRTSRFVFSSLDENSESPPQRLDDRSRQTWIFALRRVPVFSKLKEAKNWSLSCRGRAAKFPSCGIIPQEIMLPSCKISWQIMQGCKVSCDTGTKDLVPSFGSPTRPLGSASTVLWWQLQLAANGSSVFRNLESLCLDHLNKRVVTIYRIFFWTFKKKKYLKKFLQASYVAIFRDGERQQKMDLTVCGRSSRSEYAMLAFIAFQVSDRIENRRKTWKDFLGRGSHTPQADDVLLFSFFFLCYGTNIVIRITLVF